jgi:cytochrome c2
LQQVTPLLSKDKFTRVIMSVMFKPLLAAALTAACAAAQPASKADVERGRYLVEEVAKCQDCHTPRNEQGQLDRTKWLMGAVLGITPVNPIQGWHKAAPGITSSGPIFERWKDEGLTQYLITGKTPRGGVAGPPMPTYTLKKEDAEAITAYLTSLP